MPSPIQRLAPAGFEDLFAKVRASREADGRNVRFTREDGTADEFSLATVERADRFRAALQRQGREVAS